MKIFALDCASVSASVALTEDETLLGESFSNVKLTHSQTLLPMAETLMETCRTRFSEVDVFAATVGPARLRACVSVWRHSKVLQMLQASRALACLLWKRRHIRFARLTGSSAR